MLQPVVMDEEVRVITFDIEIAKPIPEKNGKADWAYAKRGGCGMSSCVLFDTLTGRYHIYDAKRIDQLIDHLNEADLIVSFNGLEFDKPVLEALSGRKLVADHLDIFQAIRDSFSIKGHGQWGLGKICERTLGLGKSGEGESAPALFAQKRFAELHDYNLNDVYLTRTLFNHIQEEGYIVGPDGIKHELWFDNVAEEARA